MERRALGYKTSKSIDSLAKKRTRDLGIEMTVLMETSRRKSLRARIRAAAMLPPEESPEMMTLTGLKDRVSLTLKEPDVSQR